MKTAPVVFALCIAASVVSPVARGDEHARPSVGMTWAAPALGSLPEGSIAPVPDAPPPTRIPAEEKVEGFVIAPPQFQPKVSKSAAHVRSAKKAPSTTPPRQAVSVVSSGASEKAGSTQTPALCFVQAERVPAGTHGFDADADDSSEAEKADADGRQRQWPENVSSVLTQPFFPDATPRDSVRAIHAERFVDGGNGRASIEVTDAWVDLQTTGARAIRRYALPLARVFSGPNGLEVFAARDRDAVQVVVRAATGFGERTPELAEKVREELHSLEVKLAGDSDATSNCGHVRFALQTARGSAEMATFESVAVLPALREPEPKDDDGDTTAEDEAAAALRVKRIRPYRLVISVTQLKSEDEPHFSLALAWTGREQTGKVDGDD